MYEGIQLAVYTLAVAIMGLVEDRIGSDLNNDEKKILAIAVRGGMNLMRHFLHLPGQVTGCYHVRSLFCRYSITRDKVSSQSILALMTRHLH